MEFFKYNALVPELAVKDFSVSKHFYIDILGFKLEYERPREKFAFLSFGDAQIMIHQCNENWVTGFCEYPFGRGINFEIECRDVVELRDRIIARGVALFKDVYEVTYHQRPQKEFLVRDPDGYLLQFSQ